MFEFIYYESKDVYEKFYDSFLSLYGSCRNKKLNAPHPKNVAPQIKYVDLHPNYSIKKFPKPDNPVPK